MATSKDAQPSIDAGSFPVWLGEIKAAIATNGEAEVPCGTCAACCKSSQFIEIAPDETDALAHIPGELLFEAPGMPEGHVLMGYDSKGHCPMLVDDVCSIYEHRPRTCRVYDCRVYAAADIVLDDEDKAEIAARVALWKFSYPTSDAEVLHNAVRAAATHLSAHKELLPGNSPTAHPTRVALLSLELYPLFVNTTSKPMRLVPDPDDEIIRDAVAHAFEN